jgi:hypothetical protein
MKKRRIFVFWLKFLPVEKIMEKFAVYNSIAVKMPKRKQRKDDELTRKRQFLGR